jgi:hypothetical protein
MKNERSAIRCGAGSFSWQEGDTLNPPKGVLMNAPKMCPGCGTESIGPTFYAQRWQSRWTECTARFHASTLAAATTTTSLFQADLEKSHVEPRGSSLFL